jgi:hypothetical protein
MEHVNNIKIHEQSQTRESLQLMMKSLNYTKIQHDNECCSRSNKLLLDEWKINNLKVEEETRKKRRRERQNFLSPLSVFVR